VSSAVLVRRDGRDATPATPGFDRIVEALGYAVDRRVRTTRAEHSRYGVGPATVERLAEVAAETGVTYVAVDNDLHPGQLADLAAGVPAATVRDRRGVVSDGLGAAGGSVAANRAEEWTLQVERRRLLNAARAADGESEGAHEDRVADVDRRRQRLDEECEALAEAARRAVETGHEAAGARVVVAETVGTDADPSPWAALADAGSDADGDPGGDADGDPTRAGENPLAPGEPVTESIPVAAGTVALTAVPPLLRDCPAWYREAVPGTTAAVERADIVVVAAGDASAAAEAVDALRGADEGPVLVWRQDDTVDATGSTDPSAAGLPTDASVYGGSPSGLRERVTALLPTERLSVRLPYDDDAHALVSWLYEHTHVEAVDYDDVVTATLVAFPDVAATVRRRVDAVGGSVEN